MARRWTINGRFLSQPTTGVQRYAGEITVALDKLVSQDHPLARDLDLQLACPPGSAQLPLSSIRVRKLGRAGGQLWEQVQLPFSLGGGGLLSLCNTGPLAWRKQIVCIHDANVWNAPASYSPAFRGFYRALLPLLGKRAWRVSTVSNHSRHELVSRHIVSMADSFVASNGHEHALRWVPHHSQATRGAASRDTIVLVGSPAPHKNVALILNMADRLAQAGLRIAVVGATDPRVFRAQIRQEGMNIDWLGRVPDGEMAALLADSMCLAFPSLAEGFGLPALEAMAIGCPVVVSDCASLPEICADAALYAPPDDPSAWFDSFVRLRNSPALRSEMIAKGQARACAYGWRATALRYLEAMAEADGVEPQAEFTGSRAAPERSRAHQG